MLMQDVNSVRQFVVLNDKSQSGSALVPGGFQFMINRRIPAVDGKGMGEWLDERGPDGQGIRVTSTYIVRLSNGGATNQRVI